MAINRFIALEKLQDGEMDTKTAKEIANLSKQIIETGKLELQAIKTFGGKASDFIPALGNKELEAGD